MGIFSRHYIGRQDLSSSPIFSDHRKMGFSRGRTAEGKVFGERSENFLVGERSGFFRGFAGSDGGRPNGRKSFRERSENFLVGEGSGFFRGFAGSDGGRPNGRKSFRPDGRKTF